jgi:nitroimidazol reductase NimA-like FMN-containing flavoprotein (pyridoxamine 5'-phosphate oxidase superfamily)
MKSVDGKTGMTILEERECWRLLDLADVGRLAVAIDRHPDIFPINHVVDDHTIVFQTEAGTKLAGAVCGAAVAFEIDGYDPWDGDAWSVVVKGHAVEIEHLVDKEHVEKLALTPWGSWAKHRWVRIDPVEVTGRRFRVGPTVRPEP